MVAFALGQKALAETVGIHLTQLSRYESGASQPILDVIRKLAVALSITANELIFDEKERGPGDDLRLRDVLGFRTHLHEYVRTFSNSAVQQHYELVWIFSIEFWKLSGVGESIGGLYYCLRP